SRPPPRKLDRQSAADKATTLLPRQDWGGSIHRRGNDHAKIVVANEQSTIFYVTECHAKEARRHAHCFARQQGNEAMHQDEFSDLTVCCDCGAAVSPELDRAFSCAPETYLCFECAIRRGGVYDGRLDR